ncbi:BON domain-containing protein, partial [Acinetobacter baumannii]
GSDFVVSRMDTTVDDSVITSRIKDALAANKDASSLKLQVTTTQGVVTLSGTAPSVEAVSNVLKLVAAIDGVKDIQNRIKVKAS